MSVTFCVCWFDASVAVTVTVYPLGTVAALSVSEAEPDLVASVTEVAVIVIGDFSPAAIVGDVYVVAVPLGVDVGLKVPHGVSPEHDHVTPPFWESFVTVAVKVAVWEGHPSAASLGYRLDGLPWLTETPIGGGALLLPQAIRNPASASATQRLATNEYFDSLRPAKPTMTTPASGKVIGSQGKRLSAR